ncbi:FAD-dependent oxidoreductase [Neorhodopirellula pilleata]|uniref:Putative FAD-binding dehydrogenase n=1 Tax=Neorhodopirellula pilleata TaxID=2714738 RepID=A0A5C6A431_9BACT|nr:FAD-dependent oxidoreductase [Neorhodopirellula pilleata]TWT94166.1 putative FAD-binding dehydrogenase [Neorhodopirellula pilleata]
MPSFVINRAISRPTFTAFSTRWMLVPIWMLMTVAVLPAHPTEQRGNSESGVAIESDVIVYGSTPGGFCAAIAAAREGASVILLEPTDHVGAMNTGGLSHCDSNQMVRSTVMGLFDEWHTRIVKDYTDRGLKAPYNPAKKDQSVWTFEPHVAMRVTMQMLNEAGVEVLTERYLRSVSKVGKRITSVVTTNGTFTGRVFVDGTYEGDLMAAAGVDWTIGREGRDEYGESLAGKQYPKRKMNISGFDDDGNLLPLLTGADSGPIDKNPDEAGDSNIMTYSFRLCLTAKPENRVPMPRPDHYDPARFEIIRRALQAGEKRVGFDLYPLPGNKLDGNNSIGGQFSIGLVGGGTEWHSSDESERKRIWEAHKQYTLEFYQFLTTDPAVPTPVRNQFKNLGLCVDEFANYDHFSPALYVRESRRMKGMYVISQQDILESPEKEDPIAISSFPIDSHDCRRIALKDGGVINEGTIFPVRRSDPKQGYAYHVPYRSILPKPDQCDNLLVPVALSCTHVGISSLRIEGTWMIIGQAAGIAAALSADQDVPVQTLPYERLRKRLLAQKQILELPVVADSPTTNRSIDMESLKGIVLDDAAAELQGNWSRSTNFKPHIASGYLFTGEEDSQASVESTAIFRFRVPKSGRYQLLMAYSAHETRAKNVPVSIVSGSHHKTFQVDQTESLPSGEHFRLIDTIELQAEVDSQIQISNADTTGFVILDALQLLAVE